MSPSIEGCRLHCFTRLPITQHTLWHVSHPCNVRTYSIHSSSNASEENDRQRRNRIETERNETKRENKKKIRKKRSVHSYMWNCIHRINVILFEKPRKENSPLNRCSYAEQNRRAQSIGTVCKTLEWISHIWHVHIVFVCDVTQTVFIWNHPLTDKSRLPPSIRIRLVALWLCDVRAVWTALFEHFINQTIQYETIFGIECMCAHAKWTAQIIVALLNFERFRWAGELNNFSSKWFSMEITNKINGFLSVLKEISFLHNFHSVKTFSISFCLGGKNDRNS